MTKPEIKRPSMTSVGIPDETPERRRNPLDQPQPDREKPAPNHPDPAKKPPVRTPEPVPAKR